MRWTLGLAKTALDTLVDDRIALRQRLQIFQVRVTIVVDDHARIQQALRIEQLLDCAHDPVCFGAPFELDEGRHVAASAVLGLERAVVFLDDRSAQRIHEAPVALDFRGNVEVLGEDEVQIPLQRMAKNDGVGVAVLREKAL